MTVTDLRVTHIRRRERTRPESTAEAQRVAELTSMLAAPRYAGWADGLQAARAELVELTAKTVLAA